MKVIAKLACYTALLGAAVTLPTALHAQPHVLGQEVAPVAPAAPNRPAIIAPQVAPLAVPQATDRVLAPVNIDEIETFRLNPPQVQSLEITPQAGGKRARLSVQFSQGQTLPRTFSLQQDQTRAVLNAAPGNFFNGDIDFDSEAFAAEQAVREDLAKRGALVPVFNGRHFTGFEKVEFIDPNAIRAAARAGQALHLPPGIFGGIPVIVDPARELMITDLGVVEDKARTFDACTGVGTKMGAWTFGKLVTDMANGTIDPSLMVENWLKLWLTDQHVNSFTVPARPAIQNLLLNSWKRLPNNRLDLSEAPMRLLAIVNRVDLRQNAVYGGNAGEGRFVFGVVDPKNCNSIPPFTVILEYGVPKNGCVAVHDWASQWHKLSSFTLGSAPYNAALQAVTDQFAGANKAPSKPNGSALNQLRTNEIALSGPWELREFHIDKATHGFLEATVVQTPDLSFNLTKKLKDYIDLNQAAILAQKHKVDLNFQGAPFLGGNAPNSFMFWNSVPAAASNDARHFFSQATCNGCHGRETNTGFTHVNTRQSGAQSGLSQFLIGVGTLATPATHQVIDPVISATVWTDGDLLRRQKDLAALLGSTCLAGGLLQSIQFQPIAAPH